MSLQTHNGGNPKVVLTIAGFDPSSGAGATADLKTIAAHGLYGVACITALTIQTTQGVIRSEAVKPELVRETLAALLDDTPPSAVKIGMLGSADVAACIAEFLRRNRLSNVVLDPVLRSSSGSELLDSSAIEVLQHELLGLVDVVTPNLAEAARLADMQVTDLDSMKNACHRFAQLGARAVVVKGGHLPEPADLLGQTRGGNMIFRSYPGKRIETKNTHGTGCAFSTALVCNLALGKTLQESVAEAKEFVAGSLSNSYPVGKGIGPVNHFFRGIR